MRATSEFSAPLGLETSCFISQTFANNALEREVGAGGIVNPSFSRLE
jgi:hypothetical protein